MNRPTSLLAPALLITLFSSLAISQEETAPPQNPPAASPSASVTETTQGNVIYGTINGIQLHLDIYQPFESGTKPHPAIVLLHGGGWSAFDKSTMENMGHFFARSGFVAFAVDYRLFDGKENRWPAQLDDVQRAVRWVRANASKYNVDPEHIGAFGHSSGAQLAALLGMEETRDNSDATLAKYSSKVQAVVDISGPSDFTADHDADGDLFFTSFLGGDYTKHPELWREASPVFHVAKNDAPFLIMHGTQDHEVPISQSQELTDKLTAAGVPVSLIKVDDVHTFEAPENRRRVAIESRAFFNKYLNTTR
jgi:acetyl esterase/lipase